MESWIRIVVATLISSVLAQYPYDSNGTCVYPEVCHEPLTNFKKVLPVKGRFQWDDSGGFCGAASIQTMALTQGAWLSQDNVRKANRGGLCFGHTDAGGGCEVGPENYGNTLLHLKLKHDVWDFMQPIPQASRFKKWIKSHLAKGHPVMWAPILKDGKHSLYGRVSVPGNGHFDHHEPIVGVGSNHDLSDDTVYDDDWLVHYSMYDLQPAYRKFSTLEDDVDLQGNCKHVHPKKAVMYPCFYKQVTYGLALKGLNMFGFESAPRVRLDVDSPWEPRVRYGEPKAKLKASLTVEGLTPGQHYLLYRFNSTDALPDGVAIDLLDVGFEYRYGFTAHSTVFKFEDPKPIMSDSSTYYVAIHASKLQELAIDSLKEPVPHEYIRAAADAGETSADLHRAVRPQGDAELSQAPDFQSLAAEAPAEQATNPVALAVIVVSALGASSCWLCYCLVAASLPAPFRFSRSGNEVLPQPLLG